MLGVQLANGKENDFADKQSQMKLENRQRNSPQKSANKLQDSHDRFGIIKGGQ